MVNKSQLVIDMEDSLSVETARDILEYDCDTGLLRWRISPASNVSVGAIAGHNDSGYRKIRYKGRGYRAHRLAWLIYYGTWPRDQIDHINGVKDDNRIVNLREVDGSNNMRNARIPHTNFSGVIGVVWNKELWKWDVRITDNKGNRLYLGSYSLMVDAYKARKRAEKQYDYHANHGVMPLERAKYIESTR